MWMILFLIAWIGLKLTQCQSTQINTILSHGTSFEGQARIICSEDSIGVEVTNDGKSGRLFVSRFAENPNCVKHYSSSDKTVRIDVPFNYLACGIKSRRMTQPRSGTEYSLSVFLSLGETLTEDDTMFILSCRYFSNRREIGAVLEVSAFSKSYLVGGRNGPACEYSLHYGSLNGPTAENARIGDKVFHEWKCQDSSFALKIYDCFVHDGNNRKYQLLDEQGCSTDKTILPDLTYDPNLNQAFAPSRVFKFAEATRMFFNCLLYMCVKSDPACRKAIPPKCNNVGRKKRSLAIPTVGPTRLYTINTSLPFEANLVSSRNLEGSSEEIDVLNIQKSQDVLKPIEAALPSSTTVKPIEKPTIIIDDKTAILPAPVIEFQPISTSLSSCSQQTRNSIKVILVGLVACNVILLSISTISIAALCRRHNSARMDLSRTYSSN